MLFKPSEEMVVSALFMWGMAGCCHQFYSVFRHLLQARSCNGKERNLLCCRQSY